MTRITVIFWVLCLGLTALWLAADPTLLSAAPSAQVRLSFIFYTGIIAIGVMSLSMILALRSATLEPLVGGLDKSYRLHKWLGIAGLLMAIAHWLWISAPGWLAAGAVAAAGAARGTAAQGPALLRTLEGPARSVGQVPEDAPAAGDRVSAVGVPLGGAHEADVLVARDRIRHGCAHGGRHSGRDHHAVSKSGTNASGGWCDSRCYDTSRCRCRSGQASGQGRH